MSIKIALAGNPNCGKTTLFNALTGDSQYVGNWPGVTVEKKEGILKWNKDIIITDLPGIYSLSPYTLEEVVARNYLIEEKPDVILNIIDGTNIERNLYLTTQLAELGIPIVAAINMMDAVRNKGDIIDISLLSELLGCRTVEISALRGEGIEAAADAAAAAALDKTTVPYHRFSSKVEYALAHIEGVYLYNIPAEKRRWYAVKLFERDKRVKEQLGMDEKKFAIIENDIMSVEKELYDDAESIITDQRYKYVSSVVDKCCKRANNGKPTISDKVDSVVTNRFLALPIFAVIIYAVYYISVTAVGKYVTDGVSNGLFGCGYRVFGIWIPGVPEVVAAFLERIGTERWLDSLILDGILAGVGSVLSFVPQLVVLFVFLAFLESCGYMARVAFITDRIFRRFGLSGKSFIPILIGTGCGVPGIMASRTVENERDRRMTVITTTFIPCSAKLPVIAFISNAIFGGASWVAPSAYFIGAAAIISSGIILKKTKMFADNPTPFVMELPPYHMPDADTVFRSVWERCRSFIRKAGTVILLSSVIIWAGSRFGSFGFSIEPRLEDSILGMTGNAIKWVFKPIGSDSIKAAIATVMGLVAKEEIVGVFGVLEPEGMTKLSAYSFLVFNLLCAPCIAAMGAIRREMNSARWTLFAIGYQCVFAYAVSMCIYQFGRLFTGDGFDLGTVSAIAVFGVFLYLLMRKKRI